MGFKKFLAAGLCATAMLAMTGVACADDYNAYIAIQGHSYTFRNTVEEGSYGREGSLIGPEADASNIKAVPDYDYETTPALIGWNEDGSAALFPMDSVENAVINGNGTYTVSMKGITWNGDTGLHFILLSTDMPWADDGGTAYVQEISLKLDGTEVLHKSINDADYEADPDYAGLWGLEKSDQEYLTYNLINDYDNELEPINFVFPFTDVEISFVINGFDGVVDEGLTLEAAPTDDGGEDGSEPPAEVTDDGASDDGAASDTASKAATTTTSTASEDDDSSNTGMIIGIVVAVIAVIAIIAVVASKKKK